MSARPTRITTGIAAIALLAATATACTRSSGSEEAFCEQVATAPALSTLLTGFTDATGGELVSRLDTASASYHRLQDAAPADVRGSVAKVVDLVDAVIGAVRAHQDDPEAVADQLRGVIADHRDAAPASLKVAAYARDHCGLDLNPTGDGGPGASGGVGGEPGTSTDPTSTTAAG